MTAVFSVLDELAFFRFLIKDFCRLNDEGEEEVVEETLAEKQILASAEYLEKVIDEGNEVVSAYWQNLPQNIRASTL